MLTGSDFCRSNVQGGISLGECLPNRGRDCGRIPLTDSFLFANKVLMFFVDSEKNRNMISEVRVKNARVLSKSLHDIKMKLWTRVTELSTKQIQMIHSILTYLIFPIIYLTPIRKAKRASAASNMDWSSRTPDQVSDSPYTNDEKCY